ncbi:DeoR/GlpR transcriptional regulator [Acinetobacter qingfengensis]|uniref:Alkaline phosphatase n=1 Tax=Acinetobacter qingfengensis TaxID=1262585 RepID=A0A1E7R1B4_9GAMM|nr:DeoR/GlpR family DNA-binding transcription regulator [Acinetobacter qingfengensis]KAA8733278.1 DeoR/GlpR transcriptional regulator [Acinetobacter qingfengensis]OEY93091.1 alkaline phosphatase [Acinetobacter qingfengensis]
MLQQERLHRIQALLKKLQRLSTDRIINELNISRETARRDIIELEALGVAKRVHGGIVAVDSVAVEAPLHIRNTYMAKEKRQIARAAIQYLNAGQTIFLDAGSTTSILAEELRTLSGLTILTNSLQAVLNLTTALEREHSQHEIILLGGQVLQRPQTQGELLLREISRYRADVALLSPVGLDVNYGASSFYLEEANIAAAMAQQSDQVMILADYSKIGVCSRRQYATTADINRVITNQDVENIVDLTAYQQAFSAFQLV